MTDNIIQLIIQKIDDTRADIKEDLARIEAQTIKTNGRVTTLEGRAQQTDEQYKFAMREWSGIAGEWEQMKLEASEKIKEKKKVWYDGYVNLIYTLIGGAIGGIAVKILSKFL